MNPKIFVLLGFLALSIVFLALAVALPSGILFALPKLALLALAVISDVVAFSSRYYSYLLVPLTKQRRRDVVISDQSPYWLSSTNDCIIKKKGDDYVATAYINIPLYLSSSEMGDEERFRFSENVSRLVGLNKDPVRFTTELYLMNKDQYIQELKDSITELENQEASLTASKAPAQELERARGKLSMVRKMLDNISVTQSLELTSFASISADGIKEFEAVTQVQQKARELMSGIASTFGVPPNIVTGSDLLKYIEPEHMIPYSTVAEQITVNMEPV